MPDRQTVATAPLAGTYGPEQVRVELLKRGGHAGRFVTRGAGYAGRVAHQTQQRAMRSGEAHALFQNWN